MPTYDEVKKRVVLQEDFANTVGSKDPSSVEADVVKTGDQLRIYVPQETGQLVSRWFSDYLISNATANGWGSSSSGTGAAMSTGWEYMASFGGTLGISYLTPGTTSSGYFSLTTFNDAIDLDNGFYYAFECAVLIPTLADATDDFNVHIGFGRTWSGSAELTDSVSFVYRRSVDGDYWVCQTRSSDSETKTVTSVEIITTTFFVLRIEIEADGDRALFYIDGTLVAEHSTNMTGTRLGLGMRIAKTAGTTASRVAIDYHEFTASRTTPRY